MKVGEDLLSSCDCPVRPWADPVDYTFLAEASEWTGRLSVHWSVSAGDIVVDGVGL